VKRLAAKLTYRLGWALMRLARHLTDATMTMVLGLSYLMDVGARLISRSYDIVPSDTEIDR
jgi:hypothetical protein